MTTHATRAAGVGALMVVVPLALAVLFGCSGAGDGFPGWWTGSTTPTTPVLASPGRATSSLDGGPGEVVPDAATRPGEGSEGSPSPAPSYQGPNLEPDGSTPTPTPSTPTATPPPSALTIDGSAVAPPAGPVVIVCVVPVTMPGETYSERYDCEGLPGDNDQGIDFSSTGGSGDGTDTHCSSGNPAPVKCPSGAFCRVYSAGATLEGMCL